MEPLVPLKRAAQLLGISKTTAYTLVKAGEFPLPVRRVGRKLMVSGTSLERFLKDDDTAVPA